MKWVKHMSDTMSDSKIQKLMMRHGIIGYGIYVGVREIIANKICPENVTFELEDDEEILSYKFKIEAELIKEILDYCVTLDLFEYNEVRKRYTCMKLLKYLDNYMTKNIEMQKVVIKAREKYGDSLNIPQST